MSLKYNALFLDEVKDFIETLTDFEQGKVNAAITTLGSGDFKSIYIKTLKSPIKELIINKYRFIFFLNKKTAYFIKAFIKKSAKTPKEEIKNAEKLYKAIIKII